MFHSRLITVAICFSLLFAVACKSPVAQQFYTGDLTLAYAENLTDFSPLTYEAKNRRVLANLYEPLVRFDKNFRLTSALALSWGRVTDTEWEFHLRDGVYFHDGSDFTTKDALYSLNLARESHSDLAALLQNIVSVEAVDGSTLRITTAKPDPLLLNKLTTVYMVPQYYEDWVLPVGTGPYAFSGIKGKGLLLKRFDEYWGPLAYFKDVYLNVIPKPEERVQAILNKDVQFLVHVPPADVDTLRQAGIDVESFPALEVSFLVLGQQGVLQDASLREAIDLALSTTYAEQFGGGYLKETSQVAASGIEGYVPDWAEREQNVDAARLLRAKHSGEVQLTLDVPQGLKALGDQIALDLGQIDIAVTVNELPIKDYEAKIQSGASEFYFFGWKYDLGDVSDFYGSVLHSPAGDLGNFNAFGYKNPEVDALIEKADQSLDEVERRGILQDIARRVQQDYVVLPLFEAQVLYGIRPELLWDIRLDGQIFASEITGNVVE